MGTRKSRSSLGPMAVGSCLAFFASALGLAACSHGVAKAPPLTTANAPVVAPPALRLVPLGGQHPTREGSAVALARFGARTLAVVADEDDSVLHAVDIDTSEEIATTRLGGKPSQLVIGPSGKIYVTLRDRDVVEVFEATGKSDASLTSVARIAAESEPVGLALTADGSKLVVTSGWGHALTVHDAATGARTARFDLARDPRSVVVSDDGAKAYVSHVVGARVSVVDLRGATATARLPVHEMSLAESDPTGERKAKADDAKASEDGDQQVARSSVDGKPRRMPRMGTPGARGAKEARIGCQGFALAKSVAPSGRVLAPQVLVDPGNTEERPSGYGSGGSLPTEMSSIAVIDEGTGEPFAASLRLPLATGRANQDAEDPCVLPRAAAVSAKTHSLFVACLGLDAVVEYDAASIDPRTTERRRFAVASGPIGIALDVSDERDAHDGAAPRPSRAVVWSQFDRTLNVIDLDAPKSPNTRIALTRKASPPSRFDLALGRKLFHAAGDPRIAADGRACASCHPDGRDDAITWATPEGPRQTPMLVGRLEGTAPYGWAGGGKNVHTHVRQTFQRLSGAGVTAPELDALIAYVASLTPPAAHARTGAGAGATDSTDADLVARGRAIFSDPASECATCHAGRAGADGEKHGVASKTTADTIDSFDTPSLRFVGGTAPYFHDGRYATLRELLHGADGTMGHTAQLSETDVDALEAYLRSL